MYNLMRITLRFLILFFVAWSNPSFATPVKLPLEAWTESTVAGKTVYFFWDRVTVTEYCDALTKFALCRNYPDQPILWRKLSEQKYRVKIDANSNFENYKGTCPLTRRQHDALRRSVPDRQKACFDLESYKGSLVPAGGQPSRGESQNPSELEKRTTKYQTGIENVWLEETYNIDLLKIETRVRSLGCSEGSEVLMTLTGMIGPDSSFAMDKLLEQLSPCRDSDGNLIKQVKLNISSGGGLLNDGYKLGKTLKKYNVRAVIKNDTSCASSCAVAFLGAADRVVEDKGQIMFHAPYFSGKNEYGERDIDCDVGDEALSELNDYYISMTDTETGERLFERTMWYCSANDGWVVTGGAAAELYGIATER